MVTASPAHAPSLAICVYCGAAAGENPAYAAAARTLGEAMAKAGIGLVYGGGGIGLMGEVARAVLSGGGHVLGVIPEFLKAREVHLKAVTELIVTKDMHERKMTMFQRADAFVTLPGGMGTLEELFEQLTWAQLGQHKKPIIIANIGGFWDPLITLLDHMGEQGFLHKAFIAGAGSPRYQIVSEAAGILPACLAQLPAKGVHAADADIARKF